MANTYDPEEARAIAIAALSLVYALACVLKRMGVLDPEAIENTFEAALVSTENAFAPDDRAAALAQQLLDLMGTQLAGRVQPLGASSDRRSDPASRDYTTVGSVIG